MARFVRFWYFIKLTRPLFLGGGVILYLLGALTAVVEGAPFNLGRLITGQVLVTAIQLMTHYTNEYFDQEGDRLNTTRTWVSGGSGVLSSGALSPRTARRAALVVTGFAVLALLVAGLQVPLVLVFGALAFLAAWSYSGPPLTLVRTGWGELSASLVVALMVPLVGCIMQSGGRLSLTLLVICLPLILLHFAMLIAFQIPDRQADEVTGKRTLAVRFGGRAAARLHNLSIFLAFCVILGLSIAHWPGSQLAWLSIPLGAWQLITVRRYLSPSTRGFTGLTTGALGLFALTAFLWLAGLTLLWIRM